MTRWLGRHMPALVAVALIVLLVAGVALVLIGGLALYTVQMFWGG